MKTKIIYLGIAIVLSVVIIILPYIFAEKNIIQSVAEKTSIAWGECDNTPARIKIKSIDGVNGMMEFKLECWQSMFESHGNFSIASLPDGSVRENHSGYQLYIHTKKDKTATEIIDNLLRQHNKDERCEIRVANKYTGFDSFYVLANEDVELVNGGYRPNIDCEIFGKVADHSSEHFYDFSDFVLVVRSSDGGGAYSFDVKSVRFIPE